MPDLTHGKDGLHTLKYIELKLKNNKGKKVNLSCVQCSYHIVVEEE